MGYPHLRLKAKALKDRGFPCNCSGLLVGLVEKMNEEAGVGGMVNGGEMRNVLSGHMLHSLIYASPPD